MDYLGLLKRAFDREESFSKITECSVLTRLSYHNFTQGRNLSCILVCPLLPSLSERFVIFIGDIRD